MPAFLLLCSTGLSVFSNSSFCPHFLLSFWDSSKTQMRFLCIFYESYPSVQYILYFSSSRFYFHSFLWTMFSSSLMLTSHLSVKLAYWVNFRYFIFWFKNMSKKKIKACPVLFQSALSLFYINSFQFPTIIYYLCFCLYYFCFCFSTC